MSHHHVTRAQGASLLFRTHAEARALWEALLREVPAPLALCLMPDHIHLLHERPVRRAFGHALRSYALWRNAHRGESGPVFGDQPPAEEVRGRTKERRSIRYIHLNPCRAGLVADPLAWPWSTHRDRVGLALPPRVPVHPRPHDLQRYVSGDPTVALEGTLLPVANQLLGAEHTEELADAVTELLRVPRSALHRRGAPRTLWLQALRQLTDLPAPAIATRAGVTTRTVFRAPRFPSPDVRLVARVARDPRFPGLHDGDLRFMPSWHRYRHRP